MGPDLELGELFAAGGERLADRDVRVEDPRVEGVYDAVCRRAFPPSPTPHSACWLWSDKGGLDTRAREHLRRLSRW